MVFKADQVEDGLNTVVEEVLDWVSVTGCDSDLIATVRDTLTNHWEEIVDAFYISANRKVDDELSTAH